MLCPNREHQILREELRAGNAGDGHRDDGQVHAPLGKEREQPAGAGLVQFEIDARRAAVERGQRRW